MILERSRMHQASGNDGEVEISESFIGEERLDWEPNFLLDDQKLKEILVSKKSNNADQDIKTSLQYENREMENTDDDNEKNSNTVRNISDKVATKFQCDIHYLTSFFNEALGNNDEVASILFQSETDELDNYAVDSFCHECQSDIHCDEISSIFLEPKSLGFPSMDFSQGFKLNCLPKEIMSIDKEPWYGPYSEFGSCSLDSYLNLDLYRIHAHVIDDETETIIENIYVLWLVCRALGWTNKNQRAIGLSETQGNFMEKAVSAFEPCLQYLSSVIESDSAGKIEDTCQSHCMPPEKKCDLSDNTSNSQNELKYYERFNQEEFEPIAARKHDYNVFCNIPDVLSNLDTLDDSINKDNEVQFVDKHTLSDLQMVTSENFQNSNLNDSLDISLDNGVRNHNARNSNCEPADSKTNNSTSPYSFMNYSQMKMRLNKSKLLKNTIMRKGYISHKLTGRGNSKSNIIPENSVAIISMNSLKEFDHYEDLQNAENRLPATQSLGHIASSITEATTDLVDKLSDCCGEGRVDAINTTHQPMTGCRAMQGPDKATQNDARKSSPRIVKQQCNIESGKHCTASESDNQCRCNDKSNQSKHTPNKNRLKILKILKYRRNLSSNHSLSVSSESNFDKRKKYNSRISGDSFSSNNQTERHSFIGQRTKYKSLPNLLAPDLSPVDQSWDHSFEEKNDKTFKSSEDLLSNSLNREDIDVVSNDLEVSPNTEENDFINELLVSRNYCPMNNHFNSSYMDAKAKHFKASRKLSLCSSSSVSEKSSGKGSLPDLTDDTVSNDDSKPGFKTLGRRLAIRRRHKSVIIPDDRTISEYDEGSETSRRTSSGYESPPVSIKAPERRGSLAGLAALGLANLAKLSDYVSHTSHYKNYDSNNETCDSYSNSLRKQSFLKSSSHDALQIHEEHHTSERCYNNDYSSNHPCENRIETSNNVHGIRNLSHFLVGQKRGHDTPATVVEGVELRPKMRPLHR